MNKNQNPEGLRQDDQSKSLYKTDGNWGTRVEKCLRASNQPHHLKLAQRLAICRKFRKFKSGEPGKSGKPDWCNLDRFALCPSCFLRTGRKTVQRCVEDLSQNAKADKLLPMFITLKIPAGPCLLERYQELESILKRIRQMRSNYRRGKRQFNEFCRPRSILWLIEIQRAETNPEHWFPHAHGIALNPARGYDMDLAELAATWREMTDLKTPPNIRSSNENRQIIEGGVYNIPVLAHSIRRQVRYALKAGARSEERWLSPPDRIFAYDTLKDRRLIRYWPS